MHSNKPKQNGKELKHQSTIKQAEALKIKQSISQEELVTAEDNKANILCHPTVSNNLQLK